MAVYAVLHRATKVFRRQTTEADYVLAKDDELVPWPDGLDLPKGDFKLVAGLIEAATAEEVTASKIETPEPEEQAELDALDAIGADQGNTFTLRQWAALRREQLTPKPRV